VPRVLARGDERYAAIDLNSAALGVGRHVSGIAVPFDEPRIAHIQRSDGWIEITWNNMSGID
jgi:hypothetical protein